MSTWYYVYAMRNRKIVLLGRTCSGRPRARNSPFALRYLIVICGSNFISVIYKLIWQNSSLDTRGEIALRWMSQTHTNEKSKLVQVMAWCRQATSHYLSQCRTIYVFRIISNLVHPLFFRTSLSFGRIGKSDRADLLPVAAPGWLPFHRRHFQIDFLK